MSQEQLKALLARIQEDAEFRSKLSETSSLEAAEAMVKAAGFDVSKDDWLQSLNDGNQSLADQDLEAMAGGIAEEDDAVGGRIPTFIACYTHSWMAGCRHTHTKSCKI